MQFKSLLKLFVAPVFACMLGAAQLHGQGTVSGKVISSENEPLVGVSIKIKDALAGTTTDGATTIAVPCASKAPTPAGTALAILRKGGLWHVFSTGWTPKTALPKRSCTT